MKCGGATNETTGARCLRQLQAEDRWTIIGNMKDEKCPICDQEMSKWTDHIVKKCQEPTTQRLRDKLQKSMGGIITADKIKDAVNKWGTSESMIMGQMVNAWTKARMTKKTPRQRKSRISMSQGSQKKMR